MNRNGRKLTRIAGAVALVVAVVFVVSRCGGGADTPTVDGPGDEDQVVVDASTDVDAGAGASEELWERALSGDLGSVEEVVALFNDPQNSDLSVDDFTTAVEAARPVLVADATGVGREPYGSYFLPGAPALPDTTPPVLCTDVNVKAANARAASGEGDVVAVMLLWDGNCPVAAAGPARTAVIVLERVDGRWVPTRSTPAGSTPAVASSLDGRRFPLVSACTFIDDFAADRSNSTFFVDGRRANGGITLYADRSAPVFNVERGQVAQVGWTPELGSYVTVSAVSGPQWIYAGLEAIDGGVFQGAALEAGAPIGTVGSTPATPDRPHVLIVQLAGPSSTSPQNPFVILDGLARRDGVPCTSDT